MFEMGAKIGSGWTSDNKKKAKPDPSQKVLPPERHSLKIYREKRRGRWVTLCGPFSLSKEETRRLLSSLRKELGCGGTFKKEMLELQGDRERALRTALKDRGFLFKK
jgi:translation initiation factor 1